MDAGGPDADGAAARQALGLPTEGRIVLVRALDPGLVYKGFGLFLEALKQLDAQGVSLHVAVIGDRGFLSGGFNSSSVNFSVPALDLSYRPQTIEGFEGGIKARLADGVFL